MRPSATSAASGLSRTDKPGVFPPGARVPEPENTSLCKSERWQLWGLAWGVVFIVTLITNPASILAAPFLPLGLLAVCPGGETAAIKAWMFGIGTSILGWMFYAVLSAGMALAKRATFMAMYIILCIALALNLVGCHKMLTEAQAIH